MVWVGLALVHVLEPKRLARWHMPMMFHQPTFFGIPSHRDGVQESKMMPTKNGNVEVIEVGRKPQLLLPNSF